MAFLCSAAAVAVLLLRLRSCSGRRARIRDTRGGDKVHRPSRIRPTLSCLLVDNEGEPLGDPFVLREPRGSVSFGGRRHDSGKKTRHSSYSSPSWSYQLFQGQPTISQIITFRRVKALHLNVTENECEAVLLS